MIHTGSPYCKDDTETSCAQPYRVTVGKMYFLFLNTPFAGHTEFSIDHNELMHGQTEKLPQYIKYSSAVQRQMISYQLPGGSTQFA